MTKLYVHKNTVEKKRLREKRDDLIRDLKRLLSQNQCRAYAVVVIDSSGDGHTFWDTGSIMPIWAFPGAMHEILKTDVMNSDVEETWKPKIDQY